MSNSLNLKEEIKNQRSGVWKIDYKDEETFYKELRKITNDGLLDKYDMSYVITGDDDYISIVLHKSLDYLIK